MKARRRRLDLVEIGAERKDVEQRVEQRVADFLHEIGGARVAHERRAGVAADDGAGERRGNVDRARADLGQVHALVVAAEHDQRRLLAHRLAHGGVVGLHAGAARERERAGQAHLGFEEVADAARVGFVGDDGEARRAEEVLRDRAPQIPQRLDGRVLLALDERLGIEARQFAERAQELRRRMQPDRRLQIGPLQRLAEHAAELAVHADVDVGIDQLGTIGEVSCRAGTPC